MSRTGISNFAQSTDTAGDSRVDALERHVRMLDAALSSITDFAYTFDREGRFTYINKALLDLWGLSLQEAVGKNFYDLRYPDDLATRLQRQIQQVIDTGKTLTDETSYTSPTGVIGYYEYIFAPIFAEDGTVEAVAGTTREISLRKQAEILSEAQRKSLELVASGKPLPEILAFLTQIVEQQAAGSVVAAILLLDDGGCLRIGAAPSLPCEYNNAIDGIKARADLGTCSVAAVTGQIVITPDIDNDPKWSAIKHLPAGVGLKAAWSRPILARDGRVLGTFGTYFRECREPTAHEREIVEILARTAGLAIERYRADEERERLLARERDARAQADAANRAKDKFIAVLSHELRTPLSPVVMTIPTIEQDPELPPKFREDLAMMRRNIDLEVKLIDDLLDLSRVSSGKLRLQLQPANVHDLLRQAIRNSAGDMQEKRLTIHQQFAATHDRLRADPARLQQVFWNLVRNAVKFTPDGGSVTLRTRNHADESQLIVEVEDTGIGIPAETLPRIFDAFEQGDPRVTRQFGGLGLGLAIAKALVEMHGGVITAASEGQGRGATFSLRLQTEPKSAGANAAAPSSDPAVPPAGLAHLLLVEDHLDSARILARILRLSGYTVQTAHNVADALKLAEDHKFDLVLSDIDLPDASGYHLMEQLTTRHALKGIALTGYGMEDDLKKSRQAGFIEHITKPVKIELLHEAIQRVASFKAT